MTDKKKQLAKITHLPSIVQYRPENALSNKQERIIRYQILSQLGRGGFAQCYRVNEIGTNKQYALKVIDKLSEGMRKNGSFQRLKNEIQLLNSLRHENIIKLYCSFQDRHNYYLVMQLCKKISLGEMSKNRSKLHEIQVKYFVKQILKALLYLRQMKVIHRDVKTPNILLDENLVVKLGDFGLAILADCTDRHQRYSHCGTPSYMAPEVVKRQKYSYEVDMWSVGVVTFFLIYGKHPFAHKSQKQTYEKIQKLQYTFPASQVQKVSCQANDFIKKIFILNPKYRLNPQQALMHPFMTQSVPTQLPIQIYYAQIPLPYLIQLCKKQNSEQFRKYINKKFIRKQNKNIVARNRSITQYFKVQTMSAKHIFKPPKKQRISKKKQQKYIQNVYEVKQIKKQQVKLQQNKITHVNQFQIKIDSIKQKQKTQYKQQAVYIYQNQNVRQQIQQNKKIQYQSVAPQQPIHKNQSINLQQQKLKIQAFEKGIQHPVQERKVNSRYVCQSNQSQQSKTKQIPLHFLQMIQNTERKNDIKLQQNLDQVTDEQMNCWLEEKLAQEPYIYQYNDKSQLYGISLHLSNGIKVVMFNDRSIMAINQNVRKALYLQFYNRQFQDTQSLFYKLVQDQKLQEYRNNLNIPKPYNSSKNNEQNAKCNKLFQKNRKNYKMIPFNINQPPKDQKIVKKYTILRQFCKKCTTSRVKSPIQIYNPRQKDIDLYKCATMVKRWGYRQNHNNKKQYIFTTKTFLQVYFQSDTQYFIMRKKQQIYKFNKVQKSRKIIQLPLRNKRKVLSKKQNQDFNIIQKFLEKFVDKEKEQIQRNKINLR